jgi:hypothetical protein
MLKKVKNWLGIEGVHLSINGIQVDPQNHNIKGIIDFTTKSPQLISCVNIAITEKYSRGRRKKSKLVDEYTIAQKRIVINQSITIDQELNIPFSIQYQLLESEIDQMGNKNIFFKGLSTLAKFAKNASSEYFLLIEAEVDGNRLRPFDKIAIKLD